MRESGIDHARDQISFFMEKSFQVSLGYATALAALAAGAKLNVLTGLATTLSSTSGLLLSLAVLALNTVYLTLSAACLFAILKRGLFLLTHEVLPEAAKGSQLDWEIFVRRAPNPLFRRSFVGELAWNVDNYYMAPVYVFIVAISISAFMYGWSEDSSFAARCSLIVAGGLHAIPVAAVVATARMNLVCREVIAQRGESPLP